MDQTRDHIAIWKLQDGINSWIPTHRAKPNNLAGLKSHRLNESARRPSVVRCLSFSYWTLIARGSRLWQLFLEECNAYWMKPMATEHKVWEISFRPSTHVIIADTHGKNLLTVNIESRMKVFHPVVRFCPVRGKSPCRSLSGFPPIREIREFRENFEDFSSQGNQGKTGVFQPKSGNFFPNHFQAF